MVAIVSIMDRGQQLATRVVDRDFIVHCARDVNKATRLVERNAERKETFSLALWAMARQYEFV